MPGSSRARSRHAPGPVLPGRIRPTEHAGPRAGRAPRAQERRGDRRQAVRGLRPGRRAGLPPPRADGRDRPGVHRRRAVAAAPLAGQPRRPGLPQGGLGPDRSAPRVPPGRRRAAGRLRRLRRRRGDRARLGDRRSKAGVQGRLPPARARRPDPGDARPIRPAPRRPRRRLVEMLSEAAAEGGDVGSLGRGLDHFAEWLRQAAGGDDLRLPIEGRRRRRDRPPVPDARPGHQRPEGRP